MLHKRIMKFRMLDRIIELEPGKRLVAAKQLRSEEPYLQDHFPQFPVMPGVLMLESLVQSSTWLIRKSEEVMPTLVTLREVRNCRFSNFVKPGHELVVTSQLTKEADNILTVKASGALDGEVPAVKATLRLERSEIGDRYPARKTLEPYARRLLDQFYRELCADDAEPLPATNCPKRWFWMDRFEKFESGREAVAVKSTSMAEEQNDNYLPGMVVMPQTLILEGLAQASGLLVSEQNRFTEQVVLAKITKAAFHDLTEAGDTLTYRTRLENLQAEGGVCRCEVSCDGQPRAEAELIFSHLDDRFPPELFEKPDFLRTLHQFRLFEVGRNAEGGAIEIPEHLRDAEREDIGV